MESINAVLIPIEHQCVAIQKIKAHHHVIMHVNKKSSYMFHYPLQVQSTNLPTGDQFERYGTITTHRMVDF